MKNLVFRRIRSALSADRINHGFLWKIAFFLNRLHDAKISYSLKHNREDTIVVLIDVPGQRWEVDFFEDGSIEVEKFIITFVEGNGDLIEELFREFSD